MPMGAVGDVEVVATRVMEEKIGCGGNFGGSIDGG